jgi:hypothetical protein
MAIWAASLVALQGAPAWPAGGNQNASKVHCQAAQQGRLVALGLPIQEVFAVFGAGLCELSDIAMVCAITCRRAG